MGADRLHYLMGSTHLFAKAYDLMGCLGCRHNRPTTGLSRMPSLQPQQAQHQGHNFDQTVYTYLIGSAHISVKTYRVVWAATTTGPMRSPQSPKGRPSTLLSWAGPIPSSIPTTYQAVWATAHTGPTSLEGSANKFRQGLRLTGCSGWPPLQTQYEAHNQARYEAHNHKRETVYSSLTGSAHIFVKSNDFPGYLGCRNLRPKIFHGLGPYLCQRRRLPVLLGLPPLEAQNLSWPWPISSSRPTTSWAVWVAAA